MTGIGEAARQSGLGIETIRYYEREGIVPAPARLGNGRRSYSPAAVARLRFLRTCRSLGFTLSESRLLLDLSERPQVDCAAVLDISEAHLRTVRARIRELRALERALRQLASNCRQNRTTCPLLEELWRR